MKLLSKAVRLCALGVPFALAAGSLPACLSSTGNDGASAGEGVSTSPDYLNVLATKSDYLKLVRNDPNLTSVKLTHELTTPDKTIYFQNTTKYQFHLPFLNQQVPRYAHLTADEFETLIFGPEGKTLGAGSIFYAQDLEMPEFSERGILGFSLYFKSAIDVGDVEKTYLKLKDAAPFAGGRIAYAFERTADYFRYKTALAAKGIPSLQLTKFYGRGDAPRVYNAATSYGYLKSITPEAFEAGDYSSKDILVFSEVPLDVGPLAGIITLEPQVPHSHVIFRSVNLKVPNAFLPNGLSLPAVQSHLDKLVRFETKADGSFAIAGSDTIPEAQLQADAEAYFQSRVPALPEPVFDLAERRLRDWRADGASPELVRSYGTKGTNFALLDTALRTGSFDRSWANGSFLVPFSHYADHLAEPLQAAVCTKAQARCAKEGMGPDCAAPLAACTRLAGAGSAVADFLRFMVGPENKIGMAGNSHFRKGFLSFASGVIRKTPLRADHLAETKAAILANHPDTLRIRFRSSTNAEDLPGLTGAGLYTSHSACIADAGGSAPGSSRCLTALEKTRTEALIAKLTASGQPEASPILLDLKERLTDKDPLDDAIRAVYAGLWSEKAYLSRDYYGIDHMKIFMGMLAHPSFADESANGVVVVTKSGDGIEADVVVQADDISITNPEVPGARPDHVVVTLAADGTMTDPRYVSRTSLKPAGATVLTRDQLQDLARQLKVVYDMFNSTFSPATHGRLDFEFKANASGQIQIKQSRPL